MKTVRCLVLSLMIASATAAIAGVPAIQVTVSDASGRLVYRARTDADGTFATSAVQAGNYVIQLKSNSAALADRQFGIVASAGKKKVVADAVGGEQFSRGGVAMRINAQRAVRLTGQITPVANVAGVQPRIKMIDGHRYVWRGPETGSSLPGQWVEEGTPSAYKITILTPDEINKLQERDAAGRTR